MSLVVNTTLNSPHTENWLEPIGKLIVNFGALELQTYWFLGRLSESEDLATQAIAWPFKRRVDRICSLARDRIKNSSLREAILASWAAGLEFAAFRNAIVHNPIIFGWRGIPNTEPPNILGLPDVSHLGSRTPVTKPVASLPEIIETLNGIAALATELLELLKAIDVELRSCQAPEL